MLNELINVEDIDYFYKFSLKEIDNAVRKLNPIYRTIVKKIIFEHDYIWWCDYYSRSSYYRLRNRALRSLALFLVASK